MLVHHACLALVAKSVLFLMKHRLTCMVPASQDAEAIQPPWVDVRAWKFGDLNNFLVLISLLLIVFFLDTWSRKGERTGWLAGSFTLLLPAPETEGHLCGIFVKRCCDRCGKSLSTSF